MNAKAFRIVALLCICFLAATGGEPSTSGAGKFSFSFKAGFYYKFFLTDSYVSSSADLYWWDSGKEQYNKFYKIPTWGFQAGPMVHIRLSSKLKFTTGIILCNRVTEYAIDEEYYSLHGIPFNEQALDNVVHYKYRLFDFELPLFLSIQMKKLTISPGFYIPVINFTKNTYTYREPVAREKTLKYWHYDIMVFPSVYAGYRFLLKPITLEPFVELSIGIDRSCYVTSGITIFVN